MKKVAVIGANGYAGVELLRILSNHSEVEVVLISSRSDKGKKLTDVFPYLSGLKNYNNLSFVDSTVEEVKNKAEIYFLATPHGVAMDFVSALLVENVKIIDLSADFRLTDLNVYEKWYQKHNVPQLLAQAVYGLPELYREEIKKTSLVANPGCYPTSAILALAPMAKEKLISEQYPIIIDAKSGFTGAGRSASAANIFSELSDNFKAYKPFGHRHTPEIEQEINKLFGGNNLKVSFTPHLLPVNRGILSTIYLQTKKNISLEEVHSLYTSFYKDEDFVRVKPLEFLPQLADVRGSNFCDLSLFYDERTNIFKIISVIDNLCRGAAGQAVVNFNIMLGFKESTALNAAPFRP